MSGNTKLYVGNLPYTMHPEALRELFTQFGNVLDVKIIQDRETGRSKGFAFVEFETPQEAQQGLSMDGQDNGGRPMKVSMAKPRENRGDGGGGYGGGNFGGGGGGYGGGGYGGGGGGYGGGSYGGGGGGYGGGGYGGGGYGGGGY